jgi:putative peptidoglycan lipid II flippase
MLLAWSSLVGAACQLLAQLPEYRKHGFGCFTLKASAEDKALLKDWLYLLLPAMLGTTMGQLMSYVDLFFAAKLPEGAWSAVTLANRIMQLPIGVLQTALLVPLFPRLVELVAQKDDATIRQLLVKGIGGVWLLSLPLIWVFLFLGEPVIDLIFGYGKFDAQDVALVTVALVFQLGQLVPYFVRDTLTRLFYAYGDSITPLWVGALAIGLKFGLNWLFIDYWHAFKVEGITLAITAVTTFNMCLLALLLYVKYRVMLPWRSWLSVLWRLVLASMAVALPCYWLQHQGWLTVSTPWPTALGILALLVLLGCSGYVALLRCLGLFSYIQPILDKLAKRRAAS